MELKKELLEKEKTENAELTDEALEAAAGGSDYQSADTPKFDKRNERVKWHNSIGDYSYGRVLSSAKKTDGLFWYRIFIEPPYQTGVTNVVNYPEHLLEKA